MSTHTNIQQVQLDNARTSLIIFATTLQSLASSFNLPYLEPIANTIQSLGKMIHLMNQSQQLLVKIIALYLEADGGIEFPPSTLNQIVIFTETLHKVHVFVEEQQTGSKVKAFFRQGEMSALLKACVAGLQEGLDFFQVECQDNCGRHRINVERGKQGTPGDFGYDRSPLGWDQHKWSIPFQPQSLCYPRSPIFHGRVTELADLLKLFDQGTPRIAILGAGGMGKTSLARTLLHHPNIAARYQQDRYFVACDFTTTKVELAAAIDVTSLALLITMRGAERPSKVQWTRPFLLPLHPLAQDAAREMFLCITDNWHSLKEVDQVLSLTNNIPLVIRLLAHLVDTEGCSQILSRWEAEKTSIVSDDHDRKSNLQIFIELSLSSPRITSMPHSQDLLSLLSILPDGLSDVELKGSKFPIPDVLGCKAALLRTALAYSDNHKRLKVLVPIREYMQNLLAPTDQMITPLFKHFHKLLEIYTTLGDHERPSGAALHNQIVANYTNVQNILQKVLNLQHSDMVSGVYCASHLHRFNSAIGRSTISLNILTTLVPLPGENQLRVFVITQILASWRFWLPPRPELLIVEAMERVKHFDDPQMKLYFYIALAKYYFQCKQDIPAALKGLQIALALVKSSRDSNGHCAALLALSEVQYCIRDCVGALSHAQALQRIANTAGDLFTEASEIEVYMNTALFEVQRKIDIAQSIFARIKEPRLINACNYVQADLNLREGDKSALPFCKCLRAALGRDEDTTGLCLERLADLSRWDEAHDSFWSTLCVTDSLKSEKKLGIYKALQFIGDVFLRDDDQVTAISLFTLALEGFASMDVHHSRAECMIRLGDICKQDGDSLKAFELWETARPLFERSSQGKQVEAIAQRLKKLSTEEKEHHMNNLARLTLLNAPSGNTEKKDYHLSVAEDLELNGVD
ncbi:hypothetical protein B0H16DRAFT_1467562 [Mycena metata]|uniref:TPR-like protein n=1 Tax=Mycena metata TaxID=1033252 RepID=A0AAD7MWZ8_9AGAR|nr:hypothetical protein B0H16DRAFT_1467562 [Mycena metata]